ncbi:hypothetical protein [Gulosibacter sediminis]|uniref:hypothetical protein n=1 Tax=Gulosibacter sediminis TaxID=1729695 RepID=UPI0024A94BA7|nr:hypothetical protein [Gulosibacter sediminis]
MDFREPSRWLLPAGIVAVLVVLAIAVVVPLLPNGPSRDDVIEACASNARSQLVNPTSARMLDLEASKSGDNWIAGGKIDAETETGLRAEVTMTCAVTISNGKIANVDVSLTQ